MADKTLAQLRRWNTDSLQALDDAIHALLEERTRENAAPLPVKPDRTVVKTRRQGTVTQRLEYVRSGKASCHCAQDAGHGLSTGLDDYEIDVYLNMIDQDVQALNDASC